VIRTSVIKPAIPNRTSISGSSKGRTENRDAFDGLSGGNGQHNSVYPSLVSHRLYIVMLRIEAARTKLATDILG